MRSEELVEAYNAWLSTFDWDWFATLTFRGIPSMAKARRCFHTWITELEGDERTPDFKWIRVTERGAYGSNIHFHVLVGGLRAAKRFAWTVRWRELAGEAVITDFDSHQGGIRYVVKTVRPNCKFDIDFNLDHAIDQ